MRVAPWGGCTQYRRYSGYVLARSRAGSAVNVPQCTTERRYAVGVGCAGASDYSALLPTNETGRPSTRDRTVPEQWQHEHASTVRRFCMRVVKLGDGERRRAARMCERSLSHKHAAHDGPIGGAGEREDGGERELDARLVCSRKRTLAAARVRPPR